MADDRIEREACRINLPNMTDSLTSAQRSRVMSRIRGLDTKPEMAVRRTLHSLGFRYRLHRRDLPGTLTSSCRAGRL